MEQRLRHLASLDGLPSNHFDYLNRMKNEMNIEPNIIYDIGSCVLHWTNKASLVWPNSKYFLFEAMESVEFLYKETNHDYTIGVFSDVDDKEIIFYKNDFEPGGNSYYRENSKLSNFDNFEAIARKTITIDTVVKQKNYPKPDLVKIDVQGCEIDILNGMKETLESCKNLIVELQHEQYNHGALLSNDSVIIIESMGFNLITPLFQNNGYDGDYHFQKD